MDGDQVTIERGEGLSRASGCLCDEVVEMTRDIG
jgi:hypothetical protein